MVLGVLGIIFICVSINHLGLIDALQKLIKHNIPIVSCCKCLTFWVCLIFLIGKTNVVWILFTSFLASYLSLWVELAMGFVDKFYISVYEKIFGETDFDKT